MTTGQKIIELASQFAGLTEVRQNAAWDDLQTKGIDERAKRLRAILEAAGHQPGWPYCMSFCRAIYIEAYKGTEHEKTVRALLSAHVMTSWGNCIKKKLTSKTPKEGAIFFMQKGTTSYGHAGLVVADIGGGMKTVEGNTSAQPAKGEADRNGDGVYFKKRSTEITGAKGAGMHLIGFLHPF